MVSSVPAGPSRLFELDGVWHWAATVLQKYVGTETTYFAECGAQATMSWDKRVWGRRTWGMEYAPDPFTPRDPKPGPECGECRAAYVRQLRAVADKVEAGA